MRLSRIMLSGGALAALALLVAASGCVANDDGSAPERRAEAIIGGSPESGYPGVGALILDMGGGMGAICTGTHIGDGWVLTAAHCMYNTDTWRVLEPYQVMFYTGTNVDDATSTDVYAARSLHPHPDFNTHDLSNDIALVNFRGISGVTSYPYNRDNLAGYSGHTVTWVGYGLNRVRPDDGDGIKRRGSGRISALDWTHIYYDGGSQMPCRGDSGGPAFLSIGGEQRVAGIVSFGDEACSELGADTRVDAFADWIASTISGGTTPDCRITGGDCGRNACWPQDEGFGCMPSDGIAEGSACNPDQETWMEALPCADGGVCLQVSSDPSDGECLGFCLGDGDCTGGYRCQIPIFEDASLAHVGVCLPPAAGCDITGGNCGSEACWPTTGGDFDCFGSDNIGRHQACNPDQETWTNLPCADGMVCVQTTTGGDGQCLEFCLNNTQCQSGEYCYTPIFTDLADIGVCVEGECDDNDSDGVCGDSGDCNDSDPNIHPGATDICDDGIDQDCSGADLVCGSCTDTDRDGTCVEQDCNDFDPNVRPGVAEVCTDGIDNNCDGATDAQDTACGGDGGGGGGGGGGGRSGGCAAASAAPSPGPVASFLALFVALAWATLRRR